jgi:hypothetical protein
MQGFLSLWRGHTATLLHRIPYSAVNFAVFENTKTFLAPLLKSRAEGGTYATEVRPCTGLRSLYSAQYHISERCLPCMLATAYG